MEEKPKTGEGEAPKIEEIINPFTLDPEDAGAGDDKKGKDDEGSGDDEVRTSINSAIAPIQEKIQLTERKAELETFFQTEVGALLRPYEAKIKEFALDKRARGMSVEAVAHAVAGKALLNIGAKMSDEAKAKAKAGSTAASTGNAARGGDESGGVPDVSTMSKDEFSTMIQGIKSGKVKFKV
jgi:hypothetical protein